MAYNLKKEEQHIYDSKWPYSRDKSSLMLREHSTKSKNAAFESSIKINFESRCLIIYFFFLEGAQKA